MEINQLKAFVLVAQKGGLVEAANRLKLTPSGISLRIKRLEHEIGTQLFERKPNKLILTEHGQVFLTRVKRILDDLESAVSLPERNEGMWAGNVSIALGSDLQLFLAPRIAAFLQNHPTVKLSLSARESTTTLQLVLDDEVDIGIGRFAAVPPSLRKTHLFFTALQAIYPKSHPLSVYRKPTLGDLVSHGLILLPPRSATRRAIDKTFSNNGIEMKRVIEAGGCFGTKQLVKLHLGVGLVHDICMVTEQDRDLHVIDVSNLFPKFEVSAVYKKSRHLSLAHKALIETLSKSLAPGSVTIKKRENGE
jgi:DNA-binding transcriptional LysR family regulator